jgi:hypothetical protein
MAGLWGGCLMKDQQAVGHVAEHLTVLEAEFFQRQVWQLKPF